MDILCEIVCKQYVGYIKNRYAPFTYKKKIITKKIRIEEYE